MQLGYSKQQNKESESDAKGKGTLLKHLTLCLTAVMVGGSAFTLFCSAFHLNWGFRKCLEGDPVRGFFSICNSIADRMGSADYIILKKFAAGAAADGSSLPQGTCLSILLLSGIILAFLILKSGFRPLLLIYTVPAVLLVTFSHVTPEIWAGLFFVFAQCCGFIVMLQEREENSGWVLILPAAVLVITALIGTAVDHGPGLSAPQLQRGAGQAIERSLQSRFGENPLGAGRLDLISGEDIKKTRGSVDTVLRQLSGNGDDDTKTALTVAADPDGETSSCYLRGFVGERYGNRRWEQLQPDTYYQERNTLYWLNRQGFDGLSQMSEAAEAAGNTDNRISLSIEAVHADRSRIYLPYEMTGTDQQLPEGTVNYAGSFLKTTKLFGSRQYEISVNPGLSERWTDWVGKLFSAETDDKLSSYFASESHYNVWCYENNTAVPEKISGMLYTEIGDPGDLSTNHADYKETISLIRAYLDDNYLYTENYVMPESGEDPIETFIHTGKGCDIHYASLGTMLFRYFGIPARYVEGYLLTPQDAEDLNGGKTAELGFSHAHAWTEIYVDGFGWIPVELSTEYRGVMPEADLEKGLQSIAYEKKKQEQAQAPEEIADADPVKNYGRFVRRILISVLLLLLACILVWIIQRRLRILIEERRWKKAFADPDVRKGICAMYGYMMRREIPLSQTAEEIGDRAAYSGEKIREAERALMQMELEKGKHEKKELEKQTRGSTADHLIDAVHRLRRRRG